MSLDPVHFDGIAGLADRIDYDAEDRDHRAFAETVWESYLDPLYGDDGPVLEPLSELGRRRVDVEDVALADAPFPTTHGLDAGTLNPRVFKNGLVVDVAHAAMGAHPSDIDLHDRRTVVKAVHTNDATADLGTEWETYQGESARRIVHTHLPESRYEEDVVHALALYLAESRHALENADRVEDLLLLDGPLYPKGVLRWYYRSSELTDLFAESSHVARVLDNYVRLVEAFAERDAALAGFVKNVSAKSVVRTLAGRGDVGPVPWAHDAAFFSQVLERRRQSADGTATAGGARSGLVGGPDDRRTDELTLTNWFVSTAGVDAFFGDPDNDLLDRELAAEEYRVAFCVVYDPRRDLVYKVEAPYAIAADADVRRRIERQVLAEVAIQRGPPRAIAKADGLARIDGGSVDSLVRSFERSYGTELDENYDAVRWGREY